MKLKPFERPEVGEASSKGGDEGVLNQPGTDWGRGVCMSLVLCLHPKCT